MDKEKLINAIEDYLFPIDEIDEDDEKSGLQLVKELYLDSKEDEDEKWKKKTRPLKGLNKAIVVTPEMKKGREVIVEDLTDDHDAYQRAIDDILGKVRKINDKLNED